MSLIAQAITTRFDGRSMPRKRRDASCRFAGYLVLALAAFLLLSVSNSRAQDIPVQTDVEPPPLKLLSKDEKQQLETQTDVKKHTILTLALMNSRLTKAEELNGKEHFEDMYKELGRFHALMDNGLSFLVKKDSDSSKVLYNFKKLEIGLRAFLPRLELIRRDLPARYEPYLKSLVKYIQEAREKAIEPFFGDTVIPNKKGR